MPVEYYAHYEKEKETKQLLRNHLAAVAQATSERIPPVIRFKYLNNQQIKDICYWLGYLHDFGKYTDYFQHYLQEGKESPYKNHAHISACLIYNFLKHKVFQTNTDPNTQIILFFSYLVVRLHHGGLRMDDLFPFTNERRMWHEVEHLEEHLRKKLTEIVIDIGLDGIFSLEEFANYLQVDSLRRNKKFQYKPEQFRNGRVQDTQWYFFLIYLFSLLIDLDKLDAADLKPKEIKSVSPERVIVYLQNKERGKKKKKDVYVKKVKTKLFLDQRENARKSIMAVINALTDDDIRNARFFLLTAPTGIGKTLSSLQCALRLQERIKQIEGYTPRIITAIPFINVIEQHRKDYEQVFGEDVNLIVHHRLADFTKGSNEQEEIPVDKALLGVESWEGDVILTTFVQLFQSLFTGNNRLLKKVNKLAGGIVILDEAQAIPEDYMPFIGAAIQKIAEHYGTRFILMTATQPKLLEFGNLLNPEGKKYKPITLLPDYKEYFQRLKRTKLVPLLDRKRDNESFIELLYEKWDKKSSVLIVVNTIKRSIDLFNEIKKALKEEKIRAKIYYLSTNIIPKKRRQVIDIVGKRLDKLKDNPTGQKPVILVSTQTIEAGVDLDFDMAFRDLAPLDSIIQTAGRVNRKGEKGEYLPVYIIQFGSDSHYVYSLMRREDTIKFLTGYKEILEPDYGRLTEEYYEQILERGVKDISRKLWEEGILKLDFSVLQEFHLIEDLGDACDVFIEDGSKMASTLADVYQDLLQNKKCIEREKLETIDPKLTYLAAKPLTEYERKALLKLISAKMNDYIVQVRVNKLYTNKPPSFGNRCNAPAPDDVFSHLYWVPSIQRKDFYDSQTGFISKSGEGYIY